jgi:hypothetical protein
MVKHIGAGELATHSRVNLKGQKLADWVNVPKLIPDISTDRSITKQIKKFTHQRWLLISRLLGIE